MPAKPRVAELADVGASVTRNAAMGARMMQAGQYVAPFLARAALPLTALAAGAGAAIHGARAYQAGATGLEVAKAAGWGAVDSLTVGQLQEDSFTRKLWGKFGETNNNRRSGAAPGAPQRLSPAEKTRFAEANQHYEASHMQHAAPEQEAPKDGPRGWANPKVQAAAQQALGHDYQGTE